MRASSTKVASVPQTHPSSLQISLTAKISALRVPRNIRTRGVTIAEHDPVVEKTIRIAVILREICGELNSFKGLFIKKSYYFEFHSLPKQSINEFQMHMVNTQYQN